MQTRRSFHIATLGMASLALLLPASAVIVAGANGGAGTTNNTTAGQLNTALGTTFPNFNNVIKYSDSSGIYLGFNPSSHDVWVLSARHVSPTAPGSSLTIDGNAYTQQGSRLLIGGDLALIKYRNALSLVPSMPSVLLAAAAPPANQQIVMIGWGVERLQGPSSGTSDAVMVTGGTGFGYTWDMGPPADRFLRWGTNNVDTPVFGQDFGLYTTQVWAADFDQPGTGEWLTSNEASAALFDSGSGAFAFIDSAWQLVGSASTVYATSYVSPFSAGGSPYIDGSTYQGTKYTDIGTYQSAIVNAIGVTLIPEPSFGCLAALGGLGLVMTRRRRVQARPAR